MIHFFPSFEKVIWTFHPASEVCDNLLNDSIEVGTYSYTPVNSSDQDSCKIVYHARQETNAHNPAAPSVILELKKINEGTEILFRTTLYPDNKALYLFLVLTGVIAFIFILFLYQLRRVDSSCFLFPISLGLYVIVFRVIFWICSYNILGCIKTFIDQS